MDIHLPKPFHNWREFLKEYGIIVLGVLTALGLEQAIESWHEREQTVETRHAIEAEIRQGIATANILAETQTCRRQQLKALAIAVGKGSREGVQRLLAQSRALPSIRFSDAAWTTALATGVANRLDREERSRYVATSAIAHNFPEFVSSYYRAQSRLDWLTQGGLGSAPAASGDAVAQLAEMASIISNMEGSSAAFLQFAEQGLGLKATQADYAALSASENLRECQAAAKAMMGEAGGG